MTFDNCSLNKEEKDRASRPLIVLLLLSLLFAGARSVSADSDLETGAANNGSDLGDPVSANSGAYHFSLPLLDLGGPLPLRYVLRYRRNPKNGVWSSFFILVSQVRKVAKMRKLENKKVRRQALLPFLCIRQREY